MGRSLFLMSAGGQGQPEAALAVQVAAKQMSGLALEATVRRLGCNPTMRHAPFRAEERGCKALMRGAGLTLHGSNWTTIRN